MNFNIHALTLTEESFQKITNDINGNPRYVTHFINIADTYDSALLIAKAVGGKKYNNRKYGGGVAIQSHCLFADIGAIQRKAVQTIAGDYALYLLDCFEAEEKASVSDIIRLIQQKYNTEYGYNGISVRACKDYLLGLGGFNHAFANHDIIELGLKRFKALRKNSSDASKESYVSAYWESLAIGLARLLSVNVDD